VTAPKLTPERLKELRTHNDRVLSGSAPYALIMPEVEAEYIALIETLAAQRDRYETALREIAQYTCHNEESRIVRNIARRAIEGDTK
jgi:hypothetical protein